MCGIAGIYNYGHGSKVEKEFISKMCSVMKHRGPDDEGIYTKDNIGLGHRRLSIIDIKGGCQPMSNEDDSTWIIFNGEIYNFLALRDELIRKGHLFKTRSDTEVILHLYEEEKENCVCRLNGMFAFAIWDENDKALFMARDRLGKKPLHYTVFDGKFVFASEIKAILQDPSVRREMDHEALHDYLSLLYVPAPNTMFKGIRKLPAGYYLKITKERLEIKQYWDLDFSKVADMGEREAAENVYSKLKEATRSRLISDVPLGAFLSGGIDSSSIVSLMAQIEAKSVITNSIGFSVKSYDELKYAQVLAKKYSTDHHEYIVEPKALEILDKLCWFYDEPFGDASSIPTYYVSKMARQNVTVALSGDGGDENFAGYNRYIYSDVLRMGQRVMPAFGKKLAEMASKNLFYKSNDEWAIRLRNKLEEFYLSPFELYFKIISMYKEEEKQFLYSHKLRQRMASYSTKEKFRKIFDVCSTDDYISRLQYLDIKTYLCDDILVKVDRASMANSLEVRAPILDYTFMEYVATIPSYLKVRRLSGKYILKKAMAKNIPSEILNRPKMGFGVPMAQWLRGELRSAVEAELFDKNGIINELFDPEYVDKMWRLTLYGQPTSFLRKTDFSYRIWILFVLSRWFKTYMSS